MTSNGINRDDEKKCNGIVLREGRQDGKCADVSTNKIAQNDRPKNQKAYGKKSCLSLSASRVQRNPFVYDCKLTLMQKISAALLTVTVAPCRLFFVCLCLLTTWFLASIALYGLSMDDITANPFTGWRRALQIVGAFTMRCAYFAGSIHRIKVKGKRASPKDAPIIAMAPHSSFFDSIVAVAFGPMSVVAKAETAYLPFIGKLINFTQPIYVWRDDPNSRQKTIKAMIERANSPQDWMQIIIFPEGTCTNRSCLLSFKPGAFYAGVPVQPLCIKYPNKFDTVTWTWEGPGVLKLLWLTLSQWYTNVEVEFMPIYKPSDEEKNNPKLFARNVRNVMAKALDVPTSDLTYDDSKLMTRAFRLNLPQAENVFAISKLRSELGLTQTNIEDNIVENYLIHSANCIVSLSEFALRLQIPIDDTRTLELFNIFDVHSCGSIDFREYLICALYLIHPNDSVSDLIAVASKMYEDCNEGVGHFSKEALIKLLSRTTPLSGDAVADIFDYIVSEGNISITIDNLIDYLQSQSEYSSWFDSPSTASGRCIKAKSK